VRTPRRLTPGRGEDRRATLAQPQLDRGGLVRAPERPQHPRMLLEHLDEPWVDGPAGLLEERRGPAEQGLGLLGPARRAWAVARFASDTATATCSGPAAFSVIVTARWNGGTASACAPGRDTARRGW